MKEKKKILSETRFCFGPHRPNTSKMGEKWQIFSCRLLVHQFMKWHDSAWRVHYKHMQYKLWPYRNNHGLLSHCHNPILHTAVMKTHVISWADELEGFQIKSSAHSFQSFLWEKFCFGSALEKLDGSLVAHSQKSSIIWYKIYHSLIKNLSSKPSCLNNQGKHFVKPLTNKLKKEQSSTEALNWYADLVSGREFSSPYFIPCLILKYAQLQSWP